MPHYAHIRPTGANPCLKRSSKGNPFILGRGEFPVDTSLNPSAPLLEQPIAIVSKFSSLEGANHLLRRLDEVKGIRNVGCKENRATLLSTYGMCGLHRDPKAPGV